jgi:NAD(P)-dependent dehydrogenase (short-subunit alcohol dehydrogenase family)
MKELFGKVAVVTGAASGIGKALARRFGEAGMKVVLADVEQTALASAGEELRAAGIDCISVLTDVRRESDVVRLADAAERAYGAVHVLCNNAGVFAGGLAWESPREDYVWLIDVNVWGVVHGVCTFVPRMRAHGEDAHIVNTASMAAVTNGPFSAIYYMTKHAVLGYTEALYHDLQMTQTNIGVSVLCPELIATRIADARRNRPADLAASDFNSPERELAEGTLRELAARQGLDPAVLAARVVDAIRENRFYILSDDGWRRSCEVRLEDVRLARNPTFSIPTEGSGEKRS